MVVLITALLIASVASSVVFVGTATAAPELNNAQTPDGISDIIELNYDTALTVEGDADDLEEAFVLRAETENDVEIVDARVGDPETTVVLELSDRVIPQDGDLESALTFENDASDTLVADRNANGGGGTQPVESFSEERVANELDPPAPQTAIIPEAAPETLQVTFENDIEAAGDTDDLGEAFSLDTQTINDVAIESTGATVLSDKQTLELELSEAVVPQDGDLGAALSFTQLDAEDTLQSRSDQVALADFDGQTVENDLDPPAPLVARVPEAAPETLEITFEDAIRIDGTDDDLGEAFDINAATENDVTIEPTEATVRDSGKTLQIDLSDAVVADDGTLDDALSFSQFTADDTLRTHESGVVIDNFDELYVANERVPGDIEDTDSGGGNETSGGGVVTGPPTSVTEGQARILCDADRAAPGTTFEIDMTQLVEIVFPSVDGTCGLIGVDELRHLPPEAPPLTPSTPFITAFAIEVPSELEDTPARLRIRVSGEMIQGLDSEVSPKELVVLRVAGGSYKNVETSVVDVTAEEDTLLEAETPGFSIFVVTADTETDPAVPAEDTPEPDTATPAPSNVDTLTTTALEPPEDRSFFSGAITGVDLILLLAGLVLSLLLLYSRRVATDDDDDYMNRL